MTTVYRALRIPERNREEKQSFLPIIKIPESPHNGHNLASLERGGG